MSNPIKPTIKTEIWPILLVLLASISSFYFYANFPEQVPIHWNYAGEVDNWGSRQVGAFLFPGIMIGTYLLFLFLPFADPRRERYNQFRKVYHVFKIIIILFMVAIYFISSLNTLGYNVSVNKLMPLLVGLLFIIIGNYMAKIKPNWFMGIRTPWTMSSEENWTKTHRVGGKIFIFGGILMAITGFLPVEFRLPVFIATIIIILFGTVGYSLGLYLSKNKKIKK